MIETAALQLQEVLRLFGNIKTENDIRVSHPFGSADESRLSTDEVCRRGRVRSTSKRRPQQSETHELGTVVNSDHNVQIGGVLGPKN